MIKNTSLSLFTCLLFLAGCDSNEEKTSKIAEEKVKDIKIEVTIDRLEQELWKDRSMQGIQNFLVKYPQFNKKYFGKFFPDDKITTKELYMGINNPSIDTVYANCQEVFGDMADFKSQFENTCKRIKAVYPQHNVQKVSTFISGMGFWGNDMYVGDSLVIISLDFFLGEKCKYEPQLPFYILKRYRKEYLVPYITTLVANRYSQSDLLDNSLIAEMIYYGKTYYFLELMMPDIADTIITGYSKKELEEVDSHEDVIWAHFIDKKLLFETKHELTNKYVGERPKVSEIGNNCPGRIGRWLGWKIVKKYMEKNEDVSLQQLMAEKDAKKIFNLSKYKPEPKGEKR